ncbi:MAG: phosphotransferase [Candidatus Roizmanbacteria bacterium]
MKNTTSFSQQDIKILLSQYAIGEYISSSLFELGSEQTTLLITTSKGNYVLKYYENRSEKHVHFECSLLKYLRRNNIPVSSIITNISGSDMSMFNNHPFVLSAFIEGTHPNDPKIMLNKSQIFEVVKTIANFHNIIVNYRPDYLFDREIFSLEYCMREFCSRTNNSERIDWMKKEIEDLQLPEFLPKGICHADLSFSNILIQNNSITGILDFDMSHFTFLIYDIASLLYWWAWAPQKGVIPERAKIIVQEYVKKRSLTKEEMYHIYDALKFITLLGIAWSEEKDYESNKQTVEFLNSIGREQFYIFTTS